MAFISKRQLQNAHIDVREVDDRDEEQAGKYARLFASNMRDAFAGARFDQVLAAIEILLPGTLGLAEGRTAVAADATKVAQLLRTSGIEDEGTITTALREYRSNAEMTVESHRSIHQCATGGIAAMDGGFCLSGMIEQMESMKELFNLALQHNQPQGGSPLLNADQLHTISAAHKSIEEGLASLREQTDFAESLTRFVNATGRNTDDDGLRIPGDLMRDIFDFAPHNRRRQQE